MSAMMNKAVALLALVGAAQAHLHLFFPPSLKSDNNPNTQGNPDPLLNYPYGCCGKPNPGICRGHLDLLDTAEGKPTAEWAAGQAANFSISGLAIETPQWNPVGGNHGGGSSQIGFSTDKGKTFKTVKTWQGNFPPHGETSMKPADNTYDFTVPADLPTGDAVFAWTWVNREKEFFMTCAVVTITGGNGETPQQPKESTKPAPSQTQQSSYPTPTPAPEEDEQKQFTLEGCTCSCPSKTWSDACACYNCQSPTKRRSVERRALALHRRHLQHAEKLAAPIRRTDAVAFTARPEMLLSIDVEGAQCHSKGNPAELKFPNPGPDVVMSPDTAYNPVEEPNCS